MTEYKVQVLTKHSESSRLTGSATSYILCAACVVPHVGHSGLVDDEVPLVRDDEVDVSRHVHRITIFEPENLKVEFMKNERWDFDQKNDLIQVGYKVQGQDNIHLRSNWYTYSLRILNCVKRPGDLAH